MMELKIFRHAYAACGSVNQPNPAWHAHRAMRTAVAVAATLGVTVPIFVEDSIHRIEEALDQHEIALEEADEATRDAAPPFVIAREELPILVETARRVRDALAEAVDVHGNPRGPLGQRILDEIDSGGESPFVRNPDGTVELEHSRITITDLKSVLRRVVAVLDDAIANGHDVEMLPDEGMHPSFYYYEDP